MKLIFIFLFISLQCGAQFTLDTSFITKPLIDTVYLYEDINSERKVISCVSDDSNIISMEITKGDTVVLISGDTIKGIRNMFNFWNSEIQENKRLRELLDEAGELLYQKFYGIEAILPEKKRI